LFESILISRADQQATGLRRAYAGGGSVKQKVGRRVD
jgi:hypothetical protein